MEATKLSGTQLPEFEISLRIRHPSMDPASISKEFAMQAEHSFRAGEPRQSRSGLAPAAVHAESYWLAALNPASWLGAKAFAATAWLTQKPEDMPAAKTLGWALSLCAARFSKAHGALLHRIRSEGGQASLIVTLAPFAAAGFSLPPEVSRAFGELGITIEFELAND